MRADTGDLDDRAFRHKARRAARSFQRVRHGAAGRFADGTAPLADQEHHRITTGMMVHAGHEGVAAFDAMNEAVLAPEIEGTVHRDRRQPAAMRQSLDDLIGAKRLVTCQ